MTITKKVLLDTLKKAMPGVEVGDALLEGADTFIFNGGFVYSYNDNISVTVPFLENMSNDTEEKLTGALKAKEFFELINKIEEEEIKIVPKEKSWVVKAGNAKAELTLLDSSLLDRIKGIAPSTNWENLPADFFISIGECKFSFNPSHLSGVYVNGEVMTSTDSRRISWKKMKGAIVAPIWISDLVANELLKFSSLLKKYSVCGSWVHFMGDDGVIFSCRKLEDNSYPFDKIKKLILEDSLKKEEDVAGFLPKGLVGAIERAATLSKNMNSYSVVRLTFGKEGIDVFSERPTGRYNEKVCWETNLDKEFEPVVIYVDSGMIEFGLKHTNSFYICCFQIPGGVVKKRFVFMGDNFIHLVSTFDGVDTCE